MSDPPAGSPRLHRLALPLALALAGLLQPALLLPLTPGVLLLETPLARRLDRGVLWVQVVAVSLAFWVLAFWLLRWLPLPLDAGFRGASLAVVIALAVLRVRARPALPRAGPVDAAILAFLLLVVPVLRLVPMTLAVVPAGADMSMHTYVTALIALADGVPDSYRPLLGIDAFGGFPVGFPTLAALVVKLTGLPPHRAAFVLTAVSHALLTPALYAVARARASRGAALLAALVFSFAVLLPQRFVVWGGNPTVLAIAFAMLFWASLAGFRRWDRWDLLLASSSLAAVLAVHTIVFVQLCYLAGIPLAVLQFSRARRDPSGMLRGAALVALAALLAAPYLASVDPGLASPEAKAIIRKFVLDAGGAWHGTLADALWTIPGWWIHQERRSAVGLPARRRAGRLGATPPRSGNPGALPGSVRYRLCDGRQHPALVAAALVPDLLGAHRRDAGGAAGALLRVRPRRRARPLARARWLATAPPVGLYGAGSGGRRLPRCRRGDRLRTAVLRAPRAARRRAGRCDHSGPRGAALARRARGAGRRGAHQPGGRRDLGAGHRVPARNRPPRERGLPAPPGEARPAALRPGRRALHLRRPDLPPYPGGDRGRGRLAAAPRERRGRGLRARGATGAGLVEHRKFNLRFR